jgi:hypothetical protein
MVTHGFIERQLSVALLARIPGLFHRAHKLCREVVKDNPCLCVPSLQVGDIRNAAIDFTLNTHLKDGAYQDISAAFKPYAKPTGNYLQIETPRAVLTVSHVARPSDLPRHAEFRKNACDANAPYLFKDMEEERQRQEKVAVAINKKAHLLMIYGDQSMEFLFVGAMRRNESEWLQAPMDLLNRPRLMLDDDIEGKGTSIPMDVKEQFAQHLSENAPRE